MRHKANKFLAGWRSVAIMLLALAVPALAAEPLRTHSRAPYVHRLTLYDVDGKAIDPKDEDAKPYSPTATCGKCHAIGTIATGLHFRDSTRGSVGEPWILTDAKTGTQLPLAMLPAESTLSAWQFIQRFGSHMPGGSVGDLPREQLARTPEAARWAISGTLQIDCMTCHTADGSYDFNQRHTQIQNQNLAWAPTAALGLGVVVGAAKNVPDDFDLDMPPDPDHPERALPKVVYDRARFDADDRVLFRITGRPRNEQCYACHSTLHVGPSALPAWRMEGDVHLRAGLSCVDCHRHGLDHDMVRGREGEQGSDQRWAVEAFSCRGCHLGDGKTPGGTLGAPVPLHRGLPPLHLSRLSCTACHSGVRPRVGAERVQTAMGHQLGLATRERDADTLPYLVEPVFAEGTGNKIAPHRMVWPAFWGYRSEHGIVPIRPETAAQAAGKATSIEPNREEIASMLARLVTQPDPDGGEPVYVAGGGFYSRGADGRLIATEGAAEPHTWPLAHDVRTASQALGAGGCTDCHQSGSLMLFGPVLTESPWPSLDRQRVSPMHEFQKRTPWEAKLRVDHHRLAETFTLRPYLKGLCLASSGVTGIAMLMAAFRGGSALFRRMNRGTRRSFPRAAAGRRARQVEI